MIKMSKSTMFGFKVEQTLKPMIERFNESITGEWDYTGITMWVEDNGDSSYITIKKYLCAGTRNIDEDTEIKFKVRISNHSPSTMWIREHGAADLYIYTHEKEYTPAKICKLIIEKFELTKFKKVAK